MVFLRFIFDDLTWECKGLEGITGGYKGLQGVTMGYRGLQRIVETFSN